VLGSMMSRVEFCDIWGVSFLTPSVFPSKVDGGVGLVFSRSLPHAAIPFSSDFFSASSVSSLLSFLLGSEPSILAYVPLNLGDDLPLLHLFPLPSL